MDKLLSHSVFPLSQFYFFVRINVLPAHVLKIRACSIDFFFFLQEMQILFMATWLQVLAKLRPMQSLIFCKVLYFSCLICVSFMVLLVLISA